MISDNQSSNEKKKHEFTYPKLIICEGKMDKLIVERLVKERSLPQNFDVFDAGSKDGFRLLLSEAKVAGIKSILILADNDDNPAQAFKNIQKQVTNSEFVAPNAPKQLKDSPLLIDILMLPDTGKVGAIEFLALDVFNRSMKNKVCVDAFVNCVTENGNWLPQQKDKLSLAAFVAGSVEKKPDISISDYFGNGAKDIPNFYLDSVFDPLANYINKFSQI